MKQHTNAHPAAPDRTWWASGTGRGTVRPHTAWTASIRLGVPRRGLTGGIPKPPGAASPDAGTGSGDWSHCTRKRDITVRSLARKIVPWPLPAVYRTWSGVRRSCVHELVLTVRQQRKGQRVPNLSWTIPQTHANV